MPHAGVVDAESFADVGGAVGRAVQPGHMGGDVGCDLRVGSGIFGETGVIEQPGLVGGQRGRPRPVRGERFKRRDQVGAAQVEPIEQELVEFIGRHRQAFAR